MNMPYEMFLSIQLMHLTCRKDHVQWPTRKEGQDLFRGTSDDLFLTKKTNSLKLQEGDLLPSLR